MNLSRREFLIGAAASLGAPFFIQSEFAIADEGPSKFFTAKQRRTAAVLANRIIPRDRDPGAVELGAVDYIEQLLTAFDSNPPKIFAIDVSVDRFLPLDRVQEAAWRIRLYGSEEYAKSTGRPYYGPRVRGLRHVIPQGLDLVARLSPLPVRFMPKSALRLILRLTHKEFRRSFSELVVEGCLSQTQYGGNRDRVGWKISNFDGELNSYAWHNEATDVYEEDPDCPMSKADPRPDAHPLGLRSRLTLDMIALFTSGKKFDLDHSSEADFVQGLEETGL